MKMEAENGPLPAPDGDFGSDVVLYDGQCRFCRAQMENLHWWDSRNRLTYLSLHDPVVAQRWPNMGPGTPLQQRLLQEMCVVHKPGPNQPDVLHWGPEAFRYLALQLPRLWWTVPLICFPGSMILWRPLYRFIARNRYRISGRTACEEGGTCHLH